MYLSDDPALDEERYMRALETRLARRPLCCNCHRHIQDESALHFQTKDEDVWLCLDCVEEKTEYIEVD